MTRALRWIPLLLLLAACGQQRRAYYGPQPEEPESGPEAGGRADEWTVEDLMEEAAREERSGRADEARIDYHLAFRHDRWHPGANDAYQDMMLRHKLRRTVWQEYLDLWQKHPSRGDALYYHLRPLLRQRAGRAIPLDRLENIEKLRQRVDEWPEDETDELVRFFDELAEENSASGDRLSLLARAMHRKDPDRAVRLLREGLILDLPGYWLRFELAEQVRDRAEKERASPTGDRSATRRKREQSGLYRLCAALYRLCADTRPDHREARDGLTAVLKHVSG